MTNELDKRLDTIESRLAAIEARLGLGGPPSASDRPVAAGRAVPPPLPRGGRVVVPVAQVAPARTLPASSPAGASVAASSADAASQGVSRQVSAQGALGYQPPAVRPPSVAEGSLEQTIGLKWAGWVGAIVLVIAGGLGIKFAYDNGWFGVVPDGAKLLLLWLGSFAMIGAGEWVYRRINKVSAVGLFGAGVAMLFLVAYAGHGYFGLYTRNTAFLLMGLSTIAGAAVAMRGRMVSIASLALIGGNLAPILLPGASDDLRPFFAYLLTLQVTALFLSWWGGTARWWALRGLALTTTTLWATIGTIVAMEGAARVDPRTWPLVFVLLYAALFHLEVILSAAWRRAGEKAGAVFCLIVTALLSAGVYAIHFESSDGVRGGWLAGIAAACAVIGLVVRSVRKSGTEATGLHPLAISYAVQSAIVLVAAVPVALSGWPVIGGWAALALGFAAIGAAMDLNVPRRAAAITWGLCAGYFIFWLAGHWDVQRASKLFEVGSTVVPQFLAVAAGLTLVGHLIAWMIRLRPQQDLRRREFEVWQTLVQIAAGFFWVGAAILALPPLGATLGILVYAWVCAIADKLRPELRLAWHAAGATAIAMAKWVVIDMVSQRLSHSAGQTVVFNPAMGMGGLIAVTLIAIYFLRRELWEKKPGEESRGLLVVFSTVLILMTIGLSVEVIRAVDDVAARGAALTFGRAQTKLLALTSLWSIAAAGLTGLFAWLRGRASAGAGAILALLLGGKYIVWDSIGFRLADGPAPATVGANLQVLAGALVPALAVLGYWLTRPPVSRGLNVLAAAVLVLLPWWIVSIEIDRWAEAQAIAAPWMARQVGWSVWWSIYAIAVVIAGFKFRAAPLRYAGLGLFAITLLKVVLIDMAAASTGLRILSFLGLGVLLLATSVLYGKVSPRLLGKQGES